MNLKKYFYFAMLVLASVCLMPSCSEDDMLPPVEEDVHVPNPAGDDFYMFVNGEWHENLTDTDVTLGWSTDVVNLLKEKFNEVVNTTDEVKVMINSLVKLYKGGQQANLDRVNEIIEELLANVETKADAYRAIGKMISMGLAEDEAQLYMCYYGDKIHYTVSSSQDDEEGEEESGIHPFNKIDWSRFHKYAPKSRGTEDVIGAIVEGLGLNPTYFLYDDELDEFIAKLEKYSLDELKKFVEDNVSAGLMPYCGDEYVQKVSDGAVNSTLDYFNLMLTKLFTYSFSYHFYHAYVSEETHAKFKAHGEEQKAVFAKRIENSTWLSAQSKQAALQKLESMKLFFGWPEGEYTETAFAKPQGELLVDDILEAKSSRTRLIAAKLGNNPRDESMMLLMYGLGNKTGLLEHNAVNLRNLNTVNIYPAFMMEPEYSAEMTPSKFYALFYVISHEIGHSFDPIGVKFDPEGNESGWLTAEDQSKYDAMTSLFAAQISTLEAAPGIYQDGTKTLNENLPDLIGLNIAFDAFNEYLKKNGVTGDALKEAQKDFFEYYTYRYRVKFSQKDFQIHLADVHGLEKIRVNGIVQQMDSWYELYNVVEGDALYLPKEERIVIW